MDEIEWLYHKYGKRSYVWVDESWNIDPRFNQQFSRRMIDSGMKTKWMTFMRADCIVRDEKKGILADQVKAGLSHILIGVERAEDDNLTELGALTGGVAEQAIPSSRRSTRTSSSNDLHRGAKTKTRHSGHASGDGQKT